MARVQAMIFDFDETLADTLPERVGTIRAAVQQVLSRDLTPQQALEVIRSGSNLESQMALLSDGNEAIAGQLVEVYRQQYFHTGRAPLLLFPGMAKALEYLQGSGVRLALVTSRHRTGANGEPARGVLWELQRMGLSSLFEVVVGYEDTAEHKPAPDPFLDCLQQLSLAGSDAIAIGDAPFDILGARAAGMPAAAALWGSNDPTAILVTAPDIVLTAPGDLAALL